MPIYEYKATGVESCDYCRDSFEVVQSMSADPIANCPECGAAVDKQLSATAIHGAGSSGDVLSNKNLAEKGFTKYQKAGGGAYEKVAGKGPNVIHRD